MIPAKIIITVIEHLKLCHKLPTCLYLQCV
jgi:hypothetical protein